MNKSKYDSLSPDVRAAIDRISYGPLVTQFGLLWSKWDRPARDGATGPGQEVITPDAALMAQWREALQPFTEQYLDGLVAGGFSDARAVYARLAKGQMQ
jgi:TRAP-type C4-dicarboxylate transport system substrate-binding protein